MQVKLVAFRALVLQKVQPPVSVSFDKHGFYLSVGDDMLHTEAGKARCFKNLTTLARFAKIENVDMLSIKLSRKPLPTKGKKRAPQSAATVAKKRPARKVAAV